MRLPILSAGALSCALIFSAGVTAQTEPIPAGLTADDWVGIRAAHAASPQAPHALGSGTITQQAFLKASNTAVLDLFGAAVSVSGNTVVIGARQEDSGATGIDGDDTDNSSFNSGAAYVFVKSGSTWSQEAYLKASNTGTQDAFGTSVAVSGDTIAIGSPGESSNATGVNGDESNNLAGGSGAVYVFVRSGTTWSQQAFVKASNTNASDAFGTAVTLSGETLVVGAATEDSNATGVNGDETNNTSFSAGAAYVFVRSGTTWSQQAYLKASDSDNNDNFGSALALDGDTLVVGALNESSNASGVDGDDSNNAFPQAGAAYVFVRSGTVWSQQAYLKASNPGGQVFPLDADFFGGAVAVSGDTVVVGAASEDSSATGVDGDGSDNSAVRSGAAYVFTRSGSTWSQEAYLKASNTGGDDAFGVSVAVVGDTLLVGANGEASIATGIDGDETDNSAFGSGAVYQFCRSGTTWSQDAYIKASTNGTPDHFGRSVALSGGTFVVGADQERSNATGVNGDESDDSMFAAGAAYVFDQPVDPWEDLGFALAGFYGDPVLTGTGPLTAGTAMSIELTNALESTPAFLFVGFTALNFSPFYGGTLVPDFNPPGLLVVVVTDGSGELTLGTTWPAGITAGLEIYLQYWIEDAAGAFGFSASNALRGTTP